MPVKLSLTLVILIVCTTWYAWAQSVPPREQFCRELQEHPDYPRHARGRLLPRRRVYSQPLVDPD
jgi:hypothetical protein